MPVSRACSTIARARGCSLPCWADAAMVNRCRSSPGTENVCATRGPTLGQRPGLIEDDGVDMVRLLEGIHVLDQYSGRGRLPRLPVMIAVGGREAEGAGTGDDKDGHRGNQGLLHLAGHGDPGNECDDGDNDHGGNEDRADLVDQTLDAGLARLRVFPPGARSSESVESSPTVVARTFSSPAPLIAAAGDGIPRCLRHGHALAGDQGFIHIAAAVDDLAVHRNPLAGTDDDHIAAAHPGDAGFHYRAVRLFYACCRWSQFHQRANRPCRTAFRPVLQVFAE